MNLTHYVSKSDEGKGHDLGMYEEGCRLTLMEVLLCYLLSHHPG
jgi:hypothetical protein